MSQQQLLEARTVAGLTKTVSGLHCNTHYKDRIAAALPPDVEVEVRDGEGRVLGALCRRLVPNLPDHKFGEVVCVRKPEHAAG